MATAAGPSTSTASCAICRKKATTPCPTCRSVWYCGKDHQLQHWTQHKHTCMPKNTPKCVVCKEDATLSCSRCQALLYCKTEHLGSDREKHKQTACIAYKVKTKAASGTIVVATRNIQRGEVIVNEEPLAFGPDYVVHTLSCIACLNPIPPVSSCPRCYAAVCTANCPGLRHPSFHELECPFLASVDWISLDSVLIVPLRVFLLQKDPTKWQLIQRMAGERKSANQTSRSKGTRTLFEESFLGLLMEYSKKVPLDCTPTTLDTVFSFLEHRGIEGSLPCTGDFVAAGQITSIMEHSCLPNTKRVFDLTPPHAAGGVPFQCRIVISAARDITKGEHLTGSFVRTLMCTWNRQQALMSSRGHYCRCKRCASPRELGTNFNTLKCLSCPGDVLAMDINNMLFTPWRCEGTCGNMYPPSYVPDLLTQSIKKIADCQQGMFSMRKLEELLKDLQKSFHTNHHFCTQLKTRMFRTYGALSEHEDLLNSQMAIFGLSALPGAGSNLLIRMSEEDLERKIELCDEVIKVIDNPIFDLSEGALDECLTHLSITKQELAKRKKESGEWSEERVKEVLKECEAIMDRAMTIRHYQTDVPLGAEGPL